MPNSKESHTSVEKSLPGDLLKKIGALAVLGGLAVNSLPVIFYGSLTFAAAHTLSQ